jgi:CHAD domain-containing protein
LRLIGAGITLRRRTGGDDAGWHLKLPAGADTRDEIRLPLPAHPGEPAAGEASETAGVHAATPPPGDSSAVPQELAALVRAYTRDEPLAPVVRIQTRRRGLRLLDQAGRILAEIVADHVSAGLLDGSAPTTWDEIEAELVTGDAELLSAIDTRLRRAGARSAATATKMHRALGGSLPAVGARPPVPTAHSSAGDVVLAYVRDEVEAIARYDTLVRRGEPDAVHQMRVATRRVRSAFQAFDSLLEWEATGPLCAELKWLATTLGQARDAEVLQDRLASGLAEVPAALVVGPVAEHISTYFTAELVRAGNDVRRALEGRRYLRLLDDLDALLADPPLTSLAQRRAATALAKPVRQSHRRLQHALAAVHGAENRDAAIHEARKAAKRARYAAEAAIPALGASAQRQAAESRDLQQLLGDHHDSVVERTVLLNLAAAARADGHDTFTYGVLYQSQVCHAATIEQTLLHRGSPAALFLPA